MPILARKKRAVASALDSRALEADSTQTDLCAYLSVIVLLGLTLNALLGWWWTDGVAGLVMTPIIAKEGWEGVNGTPSIGRHRATVSETRTVRSASWQ